MDINNKISFFVEQRESKKGKYFAVFMKIDDVEKVLCFLTETEFKLLTK